MRFRLPTSTSLVRHLLILLASWGVLSTTAVAIFILSKDPDPDHRAIIKMAIGLILVWCVLSGLVMYRFRDGFVAWATRIPLGWRTRFVVLCILFAMLEEAVTTSLTNMAPLLGGVTDAARITASKNYLEHGQEYSFRLSAGQPYPARCLSLPLSGTDRGPGRHNRFGQDHTGQPAAAVLRSRSREPSALIIPISPLWT